MINFCQFGAGRIGQIHAANIAANRRASLRYVVDVHEASAKRLADEYGGTTADVGAALADPEVDAVLIASSTDTHADLMERSAKAGKAIYCEKPIDLDMQRVKTCLEVVDAAGVPLMLGFNRRFDPSFLALKAGVRAGRVGSVEMVQIVSRDPGPPPIEYIKVSGGLFRDMMIHDFDIARWLLDEEPVEVYANACCLVDSKIGDAGDVDTAAVTLRTASGKLCQISNSRRAVYGYDQRIEVFGSAGMLQAENLRPTSVVHSAAEGIHSDPPYNFFLERYPQAYKAELDHFIDCLETKTAPSPTGNDGAAALALAEAAVRSYAERRAVEVEV